MLSRARLATVLAGLIAAGALIPATFAHAGSEVRNGVPTVVPSPSGGGNCDQHPDPSCISWGGGNGPGGGNGNGNGGNGCTWQGQSVPCHDPYYGYYMGGGCYWRALNPQPTDPPPPGHDPTKGLWGVRSCLLAPGGGVATQVFYWMDNPGPSPAQVAQEALAKIHLLGAQIGIAPQPNGAGLVGLPVWMWTAVTPNTWGPISASATDGGITVNITAQAQRIVWQMGDGSSVSCDNPGTPYEAKYGNSSSPTCGYRYARPSTSTSNPHGRYTITAATYWEVDWAGGGQTGVLNPTSQSQTTVEIQELQVVTQ